MSGEQQQVLDRLGTIEPHRRREAAQQRSDRLFVEVAENGVGTYLSNKHYEVAPILSLTQHEANNNVILMSEKTWNSLERTQQHWVEQAFAFAQHDEVPKSLSIDRDSLDKLKKLGVTVVSMVDKKSFSNTARPIIDKEAAALGPFAEQILKQIRALG